MKQAGYSPVVIFERTVAKADKLLEYKSFSEKQHSNFHELLSEVWIIH